MTRKIIFVHFFIGFLTVCIGTQPETESSTSISISASTITRKVTSKSIQKSYQAESSPSDRLLVTEQTPTAAYDADKQFPTVHESNVTKPQKPKKKILASNLKNISEKIVLLGDKNERENLLKSVINVTKESELKDGGVKNSGSIEDEAPEESTIKNLNEMMDVNITNTTSNSKLKERTWPAEGRSLEDRSSEENINVSPSGKTKTLMNATEKIPGSSERITFPGPQKVGNNHLLKTESFDQQGTLEITAPATSVSLPTSKSNPISKDNSLKNSIRFENEYYGPTGQTDWVPITSDKLPVGSVATSQQFGVKFKPTTGIINKTTERNTFVFPTESVQTQKETNDISIKENVEKTTMRLKNSAEKPTKTPNSTESGRTLSTQQPMRHPPKFRGAVKYKSSPDNFTAEEKKFNNNENVYSKNNSSSSTEIPFILTTLNGSSLPSKKPEETTEISVVTVLSSTNHSIKSQNSVDNHLVVPPENMRVNVTKEQPLGHINTISDSVLEEVVEPLVNQNESQVENDLPKINNNWDSTKMFEGLKIRNETNVIIPSSIDFKKSINSTLKQETKNSTVSEEEIKMNLTVKNPLSTENIPKQSILTSTSRNLVSEKVSNENSVNVSSVTNKYLKFPSTQNYTESSTKKEIVTKTPSVKTVVPPTTKIYDFPTTLQPEDFVETTGENSEKLQKLGENFTTTPSDITISEFNLNATSKYVNLNTTTEKTPAVVEAAPDKSNNDTVVSTFPFEDSFDETKASTKHDKELFSTTTEKMNVTSVKSGEPEIIVTTNNPHNFTVISTTITTAATTLKPTDILDVFNRTTTTSEIVPVKQAFSPVPTAGSNDFTKMTSLTSTTSPTPVFNTKPSIHYATEIPKNTKHTIEDTTVSTSTISTEEGIYYKNYVPTTVNPLDEITEENVPAYLRLTVQAASWEELCRLKEDLRESIIKMLGGTNVSTEAVHFLNLNDRNCLEKIEETKGEPANGTVFLPVNMFLMDHNGDFDKNLSEVFLTLWGRKGLDFELPIRKVDFVTPIVNLTEIAESPLGGSVVAAIVISCVAGICVILLGILFVIMKRRQKRFNYGQRCTPVSLDAYSLDSVSIYNSVRRKGMRASKRSYGNAAFDDPEVPTHPMNFAGLANFSSDKEQLYEEFNIIPQVYPKVEELPEGAETKNRYSNVIPLPETRVHLIPKDGDPLSDYINANYVRGPKGSEKLYIACQAPLESTIEDFWRMVWEQQCKVIMMLTDLQENGIEKSADYLPPNEVTDNLRLFGDFQVTLKKRDVKEKYIISNIKLKNMEANLWREVTHLWYLGWPDQGVPSEANSLIAFLIEARSQMKIQNGATTSSPAVVHCSPGTGRTGTVIACDLCIRDYEQNRMVDIPKCVFNLRRDRAGSVQTKDQYAFIYQVLNVYATKLSGGGIESI